LPAKGAALGEVSSLEDVRWFAERWTEDCLPSGGADFFTALLKCRGRTVVPACAPDSFKRGRRLFVCGSTSEAAHEFVNRSRERGVPVFSMPDALLAEDAVNRDQMVSLAKAAIDGFRSSQRVVLHVGLPLARNAATAARLEGQLVRLAEMVIAGSGVSQVYAEGGATAVALARQLGWLRLKVIDELSRGVATLAVEDGRPRFLTVKPGSYRWPEQLQDSKYD